MLIISQHIVSDDVNILGFCVCLDLSIILKNTFVNAHTHSYLTYTITHTQKHTHMHTKHTHRHTQIHSTTYIPPQTRTLIDKHIQKHTTPIHIHAQSCSLTLIHKQKIYMHIIHKLICSHIIILHVCVYV